MPLGGSHPAHLAASQAQLTIVVVAGLIIVAIIVARIVVLARRTDFSGYRFGADVVVRCRDGHLFTTTWIPFVSLKAIRLGLVRLQYCPVGRHLTFVTPVKDSDLTDLERRMAERYHDGGIP
jgi:hypothetical protein